MTTMKKNTPENGYLDFTGKKISVFILNEVIKKLNESFNGGGVHLKVDHYEAIDNDLNAWSRITGTQLELLNSEADFKLYKIHNKQEQLRSGKMAMILSNQGLEELLSPLGFVWAAAVSGMDVHIYFQGPAVRILKKRFVEKLNGFNSIFSGFARKGLRTIGHIPPQDKILELKELGAKFYLCQPSMDHFKVLKSDLIFEDVILAEYVTFLEVLKDADIRFFV